MPWSSGSFSRTDGTRTGATVWAQAKAAAVKIIAVDHDTHDQDLATGINTCLTKDGQNSPSANLPMGGNIHTGVGNATASNHYLAAGQARDSALTYAADTGSANTYAIAPTIAITAYAAGQVFWFVAGNANTGASTLNVSAVGAQTLQKYGAALESGDIGSGDIVGAVYDGTNFEIFSVSNRPLESGDIGVTVQGYDADTLKADTSDDLTAGFSTTVHDAGTKTTGSFQPAHANGNIQKYVNGGAHIFAAPTFDANAGTMVVQVTNNGSAGAITTSTFDIVTGDSLTTTNGDDFFFHITIVESFSHLHVTALQ
ncbi:MAG: hypothetical protein ACR2PW_04545 [Gammaproteobacteria bacterium]